MSRPIAREKPDLKARVRDLPHKPGVYLMKDRLNRVIYVGKARDLRKRVSQYFTPSRQMRVDLKTRALLQSIWDFDIHEVRSEPEALLLEGRLIKEFRPKYNISFRDDKRFLLVKIHLEDPFPRFQLTRLRKDDGARYFGPFAHSGALRSTMNWMKKKFGLRSCRPKVPGEIDYKHCLDHIIKNCSAPCVAKITREEYRERVEMACEFLEGRAKETLDDLEREMQEAAGKLNFEKAAELRDMLDHLRHTTRPMRRFTRHTLKRSHDPLADVETLREALRLETAPLRMECFDISNISTTHVVASMVCFRNGEPDKAAYRKYRIRTVQGQDDFAAMAEVVRRRYSRVLREAGNTLSPEAAESQESPGEIVARLARQGQGSFPDLIIVDGGRGQLNAACRELQRLGLHDANIIGLAKEFEEIYRPGRPLPLRLPDDSPALFLLQRVRDEAHRFANTYHQLLMKKRIGESLLDDCPGMNESRKAKLLKAFGSVDRLRKVAPEEMAEIEGISSRMARELVAFLQKH